MRRVAGVAALAIATFAAGCGTPYNYMTPQEQIQVDLQDARSAFQRGRGSDALGELARATRRPGGNEALRRFLAVEPEIRVQAIAAARATNPDGADTYALFKALEDLWSIAEAGLPESLPDAQRVDATAVNAIRSGRIRFESVPEVKHIRAFSNPDTKFDVLIDAMLNAKTPSPGLATEISRTSAVVQNHPAKRRFEERFSSRGWSVEELRALQGAGLPRVADALAKAESPISSEHAPLVKKALDAITRDLKDPFSVRYRDVYLSKPPGGGDVICGELNAKNSYGGYNGFKRFYSDGVRTGLDDREQERHVFDLVWHDLCAHQAGVVTGVE